MLPQEIIRKKRDGDSLTKAELHSFFQGYLAGQVTDYQVSAMLMATYLQGMSREETSALTLLMRDSGKVFSWDQPDLVVDKHSTGGVGDKTSILILPLCVLEGVQMPMIAGRGLSHTGGTLDKLESVGVNVFQSPDAVSEQMAAVGGVFMGQTEEIAPLDKRLYALRDVTATVESIPLIVASILSKKLAEGLSALVMDVKFGAGAFMEEFEDARKLAKVLSEVGKACGLKMTTYLTSMNSVLGRYAGNALEMLECAKILRGDLSFTTADLSIKLAASAVHACYPERSGQAIEAKMRDHLTSGRALEVMADIVRRQEGDPSFLENPDQLDKAPVKKPLLAKQSGYITAIDVRQLGLAIVGMGGGRTKVEDQVNPWVGLSDIRAVGEQVSQGDPLLTIHAATDRDADDVLDRLAASFELKSIQVQDVLIREILS